VRKEKAKIERKIIMTKTRSKMRKSNPYDNYLKTKTNI
jgi:hypothetical protein